MPQLSKLDVVVMTVSSVSPPGAWCPYWNITLRTYQSELLPEPTRRGVAVVAISPQWPDSSLTMHEKNDLTFTVMITDADHVVRWVDVHPDYTTRTEPRQVVAALKVTGRWRRL
jgi:peroxiredoxin